MLAAARGLLLPNGLGAAFGPFIASLAMTGLGPKGALVPAAALPTMLALVALRQRLRGPEEAAVPSPPPCTPQIAMTLDTRSEDHRDETAAD